jgi:hypothetical protein
MARERIELCPAEGGSKNDIRIDSEGVIDRRNLGQSAVILDQNYSCPVMQVLCRQVGRALIDDEALAGESCQQEAFNDLGRTAADNAAV